MFSKSQFGFRLGSEPSMAVSKFVDKEQIVDLKITGLQSGVTKTIKVTVYPKT